MAWTKSKVFYFVTKTLHNNSTHTLNKFEEKMEKVVKTFTISNQLTTQPKKRKQNKNKKKDLEVINYL